MDKTRYREIGSEFWDIPVLLQCENDIFSKPTHWFLSGRAALEYIISDIKEKFSVSKIGYNDNKEINMLEIVNSKGKTVFAFGSKTPIQMEKPTEEKLEKKVISTECQRAINDADTMVALRAVYDKYATLEPLQDLKDACAAKKELLQVMLTMP